MSDRLVKNLNFGSDAKSKILKGIDKLTNAVSSTLGASGKCVILEDQRGKPSITKDGVTVAEAITLLDPVENIGATLLKDAARKTVKEAGDGTTTATVLAEALIKQIDTAIADGLTIREIKDGVNETLDDVIKYLNNISIDVEGDMLKSVSSISCNNDTELGVIIAEAYDKVGKNGVVLMEESPSEDTYVDIVDGVKIDCDVLIFVNTHFGEKRVSCCASVMMYKAYFVLQNNDGSLNYSRNKLSCQIFMNITGRSRVTLGLSS